MTRFHSISTPAVKVIGLGGLVAALSGCMGAPSAVSMLPSTSDAQTQQLAQAKDDLDILSASKPASVPRPLSALMSQPEVVVEPIKGLGYSQVSTQPGKSLNERRLLAIRAARLEAMRDIVEQVHGIRLSSSTTVRDTVVRDDIIRGIIEGELRGARTTKIAPKDSDTFEVHLELDEKVVAYIVRAAGRGI